MPRHKAVSTLHRPRNEILSLFKFLQKKVSQLDKIIVLHLLNESRFSYTTFSNYNPQSYTNMCRNCFVKPENFFVNVNILG